ncbi:uncharacterized protein LOC141601728 [Silene latifolia]|uniref:uncharacterized protein LOC141601728 n=1 Tax=Silene latifolia TaxID=37657 RepID=UPI003D78A96C
MHHGGRLWVLWNPVTVQVQGLFKGAQFIQCSILHHASQLNIVATFIYAFNRAAERMELWNSLKSLSAGITLPWVCVGDFNVSLTADERVGCIVHDKEMKEFRDCLADCDLSDHPYTGGGGALFLAQQAREIPQMGKIGSFAGLLSTLTTGPSLLGSISLLLSTGILLSLKAKVQHLKLSDTNTRYFFASIAVRKSRSTIGFIHDAQGRVCKGHAEVTQAFLGYYQTLLGSGEDIQPLPQNLFNHGTLQDAAHLDSVATPLEIRTALNSIDANKSPGVDGYSSGFFKDTWEIIGPDFTAAVMEFFQHGRMPRAANSTLIALIPKIDAPLSVTEFRLISCSIVFYRTVSKILANRMKTVLGDIVGLEQAAFIEGRDLFDNFMLAHELAFKYNRSLLTPRSILKVDIQKAFDSVNWKFLASCLHMFGFPENFSRWVLACVTSSHFSISVNGYTEGFFRGRRGLRQGDPLSPYLFTLCMEVLSRLLRQLPSHPGFSYHPNCVKVKLTHLIFADDLLVFTRGDLPSIQAVDKCLSLFAGFSGLRVNPMKSNLYFGGVNPQLKQLILQTTGYVEGELPNFWGASILLPKGIANKIHKICKDFLWGTDDGARRWVFKSWASLCRPRREGGVDIKEILSWNKAQMMGWLYKLETNAPNIWVQWVNAYILKGVNLWDCHLTAAHSWFWSNVLACRDCLVMLTGGVQQARSMLGSPGYKSLIYDSLRPKSPGISMHKTLNDTSNFPKHSFIGLLAMQNKLPTIDNLCSRGMVIVIRCVLCESQSESANHLFFQCPFSATIWRHVSSSLHITDQLCLRQILRWYKLHNRGNSFVKKQRRCLLLCIIYLIWNERKRRIFKGIHTPPTVIARRAQYLVLTRHGMT